MTEAYTSLENTLLFYGTDKINGAHIPFNFELISYTNKDSPAADYKKNIDSWMDKKPADKVANWVVSEITGTFFCYDKLLSYNFFSLILS